MWIKRCPDSLIRVGALLSLNNCDLADQEVVATCFR